ncbi:unnamed protein product [Larinioides sclopetarius]|uniref:CLIP domain-containing serine protease n=1 Tax=Larinioides sclopetarius TaxID=280406 RepID=A0AAV1ZB93_9ARAC
MAMPYFVFCFIIVVCLACFCNAILIGRVRQKEEPASNVVQTSRFQFPRGDDMPSCKTDQGTWGMCVDVRLCYAARRAIDAGNHAIRCGWINNFIPKVCCHPEQVQHPKMVFRPYRNNVSQRRRGYN